MRYFLRLFLCTVGGFVLGGWNRITAQDTVRLAFLGDLMMHQAQLEAARLPGQDSTLASAYDFSSYFCHLQPRLHQADYVIANLECTLGSLPYTGYPTFSAPLSYLQTAQASGIDLFLLANNHIVDKSRRGLERTFEAFSCTQAHHTGVYRDPEDLLQRDPFLLDIKGQRIAFLNFTYGTNGIPVPSPWIVNALDSAQIQSSIGRAKQQGADWIIALPHWGEEYHLSPSDEQQQWVDYLLKQGVRIIVGSHPHVVQPMETRWDGYGREQLVWYSIGNAISNMSATNTRTGYLVEIALTRDLLGRWIIAEHKTTWLWCSRAGGYGKNYTILPITDFIGKRNKFCNPEDYDRMIQEYRRLKTYFDTPSSLNL